MDLTKLKYFYMVAKYQHVTKASEELHIAQPALTKSIRLLEGDLDVKLFKRMGRNIVLTDYGQLLKAKLDNILPLIDNLPSEMVKMKAECRRTVKLNVLAASIAVMDAVVNYKKKHPEVIFNLIQNEEKHDCDISIITDVYRENKPKSANTIIMEEQIYLAVPKNSKYAKSNLIELSMVAEEGFIYLAGSRKFRVICDKFCAYAGFRPQIAFESDSPIAVKNIIASDVGVAFWPEFSWGKIDSSDVLLLPIKNPVCKRQLIFELHGERGEAQYVKDFYEYLIQTMKYKQNSLTNTEVLTK